MSSAVRKRNLAAYRGGFTIVELMVVVVVVGILAAITVVSFNGIQDRARDASSSSLARNIRTKAQIYYAANGGYPRTLTDFNSTHDTRIDNPSSIQFGGGSPTDYRTIRYANCGPPTGPAPGAQIMYWTSNGIESFSEGLCS